MHQLYKSLPRNRGILCEIFFDGEKKTFFTTIIKSLTKKGVHPQPQDTSYLFFFSAVGRKSNSHGCNSIWISITIFEVLPQKMLWHKFIQPIKTF